MTEGNVNAYLAAVVTIIGILGTVATFIYAKGKPYAMDYLKKLLDKMGDIEKSNKDNCAQTSDINDTMSREIISLRDEMQRELRRFRDIDEKQNALNGEILRNIKDIREDVRNNDRRLLELEYQDKYIRRRQTDEFKGD